MYKNPKPTVDIAIIKGNKVVLVQRGREPFKGKWVLPGGFVEYGETVEEAAIREALEETNLDIELLAILGVYSDPDRDPRGCIVTTVFVAEQLSGDIMGGDDAARAEWFSLADINPSLLAFDHSLIIEDLKHWLKEPATFWSSKARD